VLSDTTITAAAARNSFSRIITTAFLLQAARDHFCALAIGYGMPLSGELRKFVDGGGLMSNGPNLTDAIGK
jgi:hypothetical protein